MILLTSYQPSTYFTTCELNGIMRMVPNELTITVVGLGYVGLPTALALHHSGFKINGIDISKDVINDLNKGKIPFVDQGIDLKIPVESNRWNVSNDFSSTIPDSDVVLITVPTPVSDDKEPDLQYVNSACRSVLESVDLDSMTIVTLESTVYPGVTRRIMNEICNDLGILENENLHFSYSPERISPGDPTKSVDSVARIIGSDSKQVGEFLAEIYSTITSAGASYVGSIEVAESSKLIENVQRDIDIAFINELSIILPKIGVDVEQVLSAASTKWNFHRHTPGIGVGGHCIPVDPYYYISLTKELGLESKLSKSAREINEKMPSHSFMKLMTIIESMDIKVKRALVLGFSYKPETGDVRETPIEEFTHLLHQSNIMPVVCDPYLEGHDCPEWVEFTNNISELDDFDIVILATAHDKFIKLDWKELLHTSKYPVIFDGRRALNKDNLEKMGWKYFGIGHP